MAATVARAFEKRPVKMTLGALVNLGGIATIIAQL